MGLFVIFVLVGLFGGLFCVLFMIMSLGICFEIDFDGIVIGVN